MKSNQARLKAISQVFSSNKHKMTRDDKQECFEVIKEARETHDAFWERLNEHRQARREVHERNQAEFERKQADWKDRMRANIAKNRQNLAKAEVAAERCRDRIAEIEEKLANTTNTKWQEIFSGWLDEAKAKERDIDESIERIESWIREGLDKLNG